MIHDMDFLKATLEQILPLLPANVYVGYRMRELCVHKAHFQEWS